MVVIHSSSAHLYILKAGLAGWKNPQCQHQLAFSSDFLGWKAKFADFFTFILYDGGAQSIFRHSFDLSKKNNQVQKVNRQANKIYKFKEPLAVNGRFPLTWNFVSDVILLPNRVLLPHVEWRGNNVLVSRWNKMEFLISALSRLCTWAAGGSKKYQNSSPTLFLLQILVLHPNLISSKHTF